MKIAIIIYSQTEHTYSVGLKLKEKLSDSGNDVDIIRVVPIGDVNPGSKKIKFESVVDTEKYNGLIFGSPVHAFSLAPAMKSYLEQISSLDSKNVACFVTKGVPFNWTGGTRAINIMKKIIGSKSGNVVDTSIIVWNKKRDKTIHGMIENFSKKF